MLRADLDLLPTAIEEMVRWTSPSPSKRRTATRDVELGGCAIEAGQKVQIWEGSANRDSLVFADADAFDVTRKPNPHLGFGQGVHYCLGANLARLELRVLFEELLTRFSSARSGRAGRVDPQQPAHRHPAPGRRPFANLRFRRGFPGSLALARRNRTLDLRDHALGILREVEPGEPKHLPAGQGDGVLTHAVALEVVSVAVKGEAVDLDRDLRTA